MSNVPWEEDRTNEYAKFPRLTYDGRYLSYVSITEDSINEIKEREIKIATLTSQKNEKEAAELMRSNPNIEYQLHIYNIEEKKEEIINTELNSISEIIGTFQSPKWARSQNILYFIKDFSLWIVKRNNTTGNFISSVVVEKFCGLYDCSNRPDEDELLYVSEDGSKVASSYVTGKNCKTSVEFKLMTVNTTNNLISKQPGDTSWCYGAPGPWEKDNLIAVEYYDAATFNKYFAENWNQKNKLFEDREYQFRGPITTSSDNKYIVYPIGKNTYPSSGKIDIRIRDLQTQNYIDVLNIIQGKINPESNRIFNAKWDSENKNLYFTLTDDKNVNNNLVKFNIETKESSIVVKDAIDTDIN